MHYKDVCPDCKRLTGQCRCMDPNKTARDRLCLDCANKRVGLPVTNAVTPGGYPRPAHWGQE